MTVKHHEMIGISSPRIFGRYKLLLVLLGLYAVVVLTRLWHVDLSQALLLPSPVDKNLEHFRMNRHLKTFLDDIQILIEPSHTPCDGSEQLPVLVLVTSSPGRADHRAAIRSSWASYQPTYFVLGIEAQGLDGSFADIYIEAKQFGDMVVFDLADHYQNLTLKTALMLQWTLRRCPQTQFLLKTDDDVLVNPWVLGDLLRDHQGDQLVGYKKNSSTLHRDPYNKWYSPRWLRREDQLQEYLSGTGYLVNGEYIEEILEAANKVPLLNLEDVYFTYLVSKETLGLSLIHDRRLSPYKPILPNACSYVGLASMHSLSPKEITSVWDKVKIIKNNTDECENFKFLNNDWFLY